MAACRDRRAGRRGTRGARAWCWPAAGRRGWARPRRRWSGTGPRCYAGPLPSWPAPPAGRWSWSARKTRRCPGCRTTCRWWTTRGRAWARCRAWPLASAPSGTGLARRSSPPPTCRSCTPRSSTGCCARCGKVPTWGCRWCAATRSRWPPPTGPRWHRSPRASSATNACGPRSCSSGAGCPGWTRPRCSAIPGWPRSTPPWTRWSTSTSRTTTGGPGPGRRRRSPSGGATGREPSAPPPWPKPPRPPGPTSARWPPYSATTGTGSPRTARPRWPRGIRSRSGRRWR